MCRVVCAAGDCPRSGLGKEGLGKEAKSGGDFHDGKRTSNAYQYFLAYEKSFGVVYMWNDR